MIYLHNKYTVWYMKIINNARDRNKINGYVERHHIIPKSIGGKNTDDNLVFLTPKEHYICHLLLTKMVEGKFKRSMTYALWRMVNPGNKYQNHRVTGRMYDYAKNESCRSLSEERKGKSLEERFGKDRAKEIKDKFKTRKTRSKLTDQEKTEISLRIRTLHQRNPWKRNFQNGQPPNIICETCHQSITPANYAKYHKGDKCVKFHVYAQCPTCSTTFRVTSWGKKKFCSSKCANFRFKKDPQTNVVASEKCTHAASHNEQHARDSLD